MTTEDDSRVLLGALEQRLHAAAEALGLAPGAEPRSASVAERGHVASELLATLVTACRNAPAADVCWLVIAAVIGAFPTAADVHAMRRQLETEDDHRVTTWLLSRALRGGPSGRLDLEMDVCTGGVVVNVDFCARHDIHTGIHRVVRESLPRWRAHHEFVATANIDEYSGVRTLAPREVHRVFDYGAPQTIDLDDERAYKPRLVVPWRGVMVIPEIPDPRFSVHLAALAEFSGNALTVIGYDMIPVVSADLRPAVDAVRFGSYLTVIKYATRVAAISISAMTEFAGFAHAVSAQGLVGPAVEEVVLPAEIPPATHTVPRAAGRRARVLCVGSHEPHKNQQTVLHAAERLWRSGLDFEVVFVGGTGWRSEEFVERLRAVQTAGRAVLDLGRVPDDALWQEYRDSDFTVFLSVHEGFGLPVVESLACGTPVLTSNYGSLGEIAADGGCVAVDPRDDDAVTEAMRSLLTDLATRDRLAAEALARPPRTWDDYADELWHVLSARKGAR